MKLEIKILQESDVTQSYVDWYSNEDVVRFSDNQYRSFSLEGQRSFVTKCFNDLNTDLYGIFDAKLHIGNILITGLCSYHKCAEITYVIGEPKYWGKGVGYFAVSSLINLAKKKYKLNKLFASVADENLGSIRVLEKNDFVIEGKRLNHLYYNGKFYNQLDFGLIL
jgi:ribosomal-protein-alanine N-acetyltransferase